MRSRVFQSEGVRYDSVILGPCEGRASTFRMKYLRLKRPMFDHNQYFISDFFSKRSKNIIFVISKDMSFLPHSPMLLNVKIKKYSHRTQT